MSTSTLFRNRGRVRNRKWNPIPIPIPIPMPIPMPIGEGALIAKLRVAPSFAEWYDSAVAILSTVVHKFTNVFRLRSGLLLYYVAGS